MNCMPQAQEKLSLLPFPHHPYWSFVHASRVHYDPSPPPPVSGKTSSNLRCTFAKETPPCRCEHLLDILGICFAMQRWAACFGGGSGRSKRGGGCMRHKAKAWHTPSSSLGG